MPLGRTGRVLLIAGSDCSGGAGLEAGQKVLAAHGCYAMTATTALTVQNTTGVNAIFPIPPDFVERQIEACLEDIGADVVTTGMLATADTIAAVARQVAKYNISALVVDPVMVSTSGAELLPRDAIRDLCDHLLPRALIVTPNIPEAELILAEHSKQQQQPPPPPHETTSVADMEALGRRIQAMGPTWVLVKGGHLPLRRDGTVARTESKREIVVDVLIGPQTFCLHIESPWQRSTATHGTGCTLAAAISAGLAKGQAHLPAVVRAAVRYGEIAIRTAPMLGTGHGPLGHFHSTYSLPFSPGYFIEYLLDRADVRDPWRAHVHHPFVKAIGSGSLPLESFKGFIIQDYLYLIHFARANFLAGYKTKKNLGHIATANRTVGSILTEMQLHVDYCSFFGISVAEMQATEEKEACTAYTRYILDVGLSDDWLALQVAIAPCLLGYHAAAAALMADPKTRRGSGNPYWRWIENYLSPDFVAAVKIGSKLLEDGMPLQSPSRIEELVEIFIRSTKLEIGFWEMFPL